MFPHRVSAHIGSQAFSFDLERKGKRLKKFYGNFVTNKFNRPLFNYRRSHKGENKNGRTHNVPPKQYGGRKRCSFSLFTSVLRVFISDLETWARRWLLHWLCSWLCKIIYSFFTFFLLLSSDIHLSSPSLILQCLIWARLPRNCHSLYSVIFKFFLLTKNVQFIFSLNRM